MKMLVRCCCLLVLYLRLGYVMWVSFVGVCCWCGGVAVVIVLFVPQSEKYLQHLYRFVNGCLRTFTMKKEVNNFVNPLINAPC